MGKLEDEILGTPEEWRKRANELKAEELIDRAAYRISAVMHEVNPSQDYIARGVEATKMVRAIGADKTNEIIDLIKEGNTPEEIITTFTAPTQ